TSATPSAATTSCAASRTTLLLPRPPARAVSVSPSSACLSSPVRLASCRPRTTSPPPSTPSPTT
ncbi:hypothetical protein LPJ71_010481, partial [Coemansia sp. S17]